MLDQVRPYALLLARIGIGAVFLVHGLQKFMTMGLAQTTAFFDSLGIPLAGVAAPAVAVLEVVGGIALILGAALPVFGTLLVLNMLGAIVFAHAPAGFSVSEGGYEFVLTLAAGTLAIAFSGGGALAVDGLRQGRRRPVTV
ncbi:MULTISPECIES: DoxX family protein [unclassified Streptosporangium]|uniref:DoxX family protein n=1 Tax=Streptosporangium sp. NPDC005286 TaxID=3154463 RepID=UPI0033B1B71B